MQIKKQKNKNKNPGQFCQKAKIQKEKSRRDGSVNRSENTPAVTETVTQRFYICLTPRLVRK